ncbi:hypothetical protein Bbelb_187550 [Branchiostoma belcheri]|nr:hypothetical protein Bbelb_187550 [Branchiostoma belcheri]
MGNKSPTRTTLVLLWGLCYCLPAALALTGLPPAGGWAETDPTWVTPDEWQSEDGVRHAAGYVLDFNFRTGWRRAADENTWRLTFDMQAPITLSRIRMWYYQERAVTVLRAMPRAHRFETVKHFPASDLSGISNTDEIRLNEVDLTGFLDTGQLWRLQFTSIGVPNTFEVMEVKFFQACSGYEKTVCSDGDCDVHEVVCDGIVDCDDGSDEQNCDEDICSNGATINKARVCDGTDDCGDNSDERHCCERRDKIACNNGECIDPQILNKPVSSTCDGEEDCSDGSDESCVAVPCENGAMFHPAGRCDGRDDCGDNTDEKNCDCYYLRDKGTSYRGRANQDDSCQHWTSQYPHAHNHTPEAYPSAWLEANYCRNPDGKDRPWCYTSNPLIRWMYCDDVFACDAVPTRCFYAVDKGRSYAGRVNRAVVRLCQRCHSESAHSHPHTPQAHPNLIMFKLGYFVYRAGDRLCQRWDSQSPHSHPHTPQAHPDAGLEENFCRNPDNKDRPWCYTTDPTLRWDFCNVMECADPTSLDFIGQECEGEYTCSSQWAMTRWRLCSCDHDCSFFGDCCEDVPKGAVDQLERVQKRAFRTVMGSTYTGYSHALEHLALPTLASRREQLCLKFARSLMNSDFRAWLPLHRSLAEESSLAQPTRDDRHLWRCVPGFITKPSFWLVADCPDQWADDFTRDQCLKQVDPSLPSDVVYRMPGLSLAATTNLRCGAASPWFVFGTIGTSCWDTGDCPHQISLTRLFNFNTGENVETNPCPSDTVYDPFVDICRHSSSVSRRHGSSNKTIPFQNCSEPALNFTSEEFRVLPNGSVHLLSANVSCPAEHVAILNTTASICGECVLQHLSNHTHGGQTVNSWEANQGWVTLSLVTVSGVAVLGFVVHTVQSGQWKKVPQKLKVQMTTCTVAAEVLFVLRVLVPSGPGCTAYAVLLHYLLLTAFTSMNALSLDLFLTFRDDLDRAKLHKYVLFTWLAPVPVVVATVIVEFGSSVWVGYGESCWIGNPTASLVAFGIPVLCALLLNVFLVTFALLAIRKSFQIADKAKSRSDISKAWVYMRISFLSGVTWILGFIYPFVNNRAVEYVFIVLNASQGLLLTVVMTLTWEVVEKWKSAIGARFGLGEPNQDNLPTATAGTHQTTIRATEAGSAVEIPMSTLADVEGNRASLHQTEPRQDNEATTTNGSQQTEAMEGGTEAKEGRTGSKEGGTEAKEGGTVAKKGGNRAKEGGNGTKEGGNRAKEGGTEAKEGGTGVKKGGTGAKEGGTDTAKEGGAGMKEGGTGAKEGGNRAKKGGNRAKEGGAGANEGGNRAKEGEAGVKKGGTGAKEGGTGAKEGGTGAKGGGAVEELGRREEELGRREEELGRRKEELGQRKEELGRREEEELGRRKEELGRREEELWRRKEELGRREEELGRREEELGRRKEELGQRKEELGRRKEELGRREEELGRRKEELGRWKEELGRREEELGRRKEELGRREEEELGRRKEELGRREEELWRRKEELGRREEELGRREEELGRRKEELGRRKEELGRGKEELGRMNVKEELGRRKKELERRKEKLGRIKEELG